MSDLFTPNGYYRSSPVTDEEMRDCYGGTWLHNDAFLDNLGGLWRRGDHGVFRYVEGTGEC